MSTFIQRNRHRSAETMDEIDPALVGEFDASSAPILIVGADYNLDMTVDATNRDAFHPPHASHSNQDWNDEYSGSSTPCSSSYSSYGSLDSGISHPPGASKKQRKVINTTMRKSTDQWLHHDAELLPTMGSTPILDADASRGQGSDTESARESTLYTNAVPGSDGLFHCPWEGQPGCYHEPVRLKCIYDTYVDSHLKPYRCRVKTCEEARFSSTASRLRHEREAHGLQGRGHLPFLCSVEGCEHAVPGNGFSRKWKLRGHLERAHSDNPPLAAAPFTAQLSAEDLVEKKVAVESREPEPEPNENGGGGGSKGESSDARFRELESWYEDLLNDYQIYEKLFHMLRTASDQKSKKAFRWIRGYNSPSQTDIEAAAHILKVMDNLVA